jgi:histidinol phosphatase-like PHP family hydrolase
MKKKNIPVILSTDAHHPTEIDGYYDEAKEILKEIGYRSLICIRNSKWEESVL